MRAEDETRPRRLAAGIACAMAVFACSPAGARSPQEASEILARYSARLSARDHVTNTGAPLHRAVDVLAQDRANYHRFRLRDAEDETDAYFVNAERRRSIETILDPLGGQERQDIVSGEPLVRCVLYRVDDGVHLAVEVVRDAEIPSPVVAAAKETPSGSPPAAMDVRKTADGDAAPSGSGVVRDAASRSSAAAAAAPAGQEVRPAPEAADAARDAAAPPEAGKAPPAPGATVAGAIGRAAIPDAIDERDYLRNLRAFLARARDGALPETESGGFFAAVLLGDRVAASQLEAVMQLLSQDAYAELPVARFLRNYLGLFAAGADRSRRRLAEELAVMRALYEGELGGRYVDFLADARGLDDAADAAAFVEGALGLEDWYAGSSR